MKLSIKNLVKILLKCIQIFREFFAIFTEIFIKFSKIVEKQNISSPTLLICIMIFIYSKPLLHLTNP